MAHEPRPLDLSFRQVVIRAMMRGDHDGIAVRLDTDLSDETCTVLDCTVETEKFLLFVPGWRPIARVGVLELFRDMETLYNSDPTADAVSRMLQDRRQVRTLLTDFSHCRETSNEMKAEQAKRDAIYLRYMESLKLPTSWRSIFPESQPLSFMREGQE